MEQEDIIALTQVPFLAVLVSDLIICTNLTTQDVRHFKEGLNRLRKVFQSADRDLAAGDSSFVIRYTVQSFLQSISKFLSRRTWYCRPGCTSSHLPRAT